MAMPRRWNTIGQCATVVSVSTSVPRSSVSGQWVEVWWSRKMPCPMMLPGPSTPSEASHSTGVMPWRRVISWNSTTLWAAWIWKGRLRRLASAWLALISSGVQVSICEGETMPDRRPLLSAATVSSTAMAAAMASSPAFSFHSYCATWPFGVYQRAERYIGENTPRRPDALNVSSQPSQATLMSTSVVTPDISSSE